MALTWALQGLRAQSYFDPALIVTSSVSIEFSTTTIEMERVADIFDQDKDGYIDYYEFVAALHPNKESYKPATDADKIEDEVKYISVSIDSIWI